MFGDGPKAIIPYDPYRFNTELCIELELIAEFAGGSVDQWEKRSWAERRMWVYYRILLNEKKSRHEKRMAEEMERNEQIRKDMPKVRADRPGIRG